MKKFYSILAAALVTTTAWAQATVPATLSISDEATFGTWTVIDNNASSSANTWTYSDGEALYTEDRYYAADDWLIAPAVTLEAGVTYEISYYIINRSNYSTDKQKYAITVGTDATIEAQATILAYNESFNTKTYSARTCKFTPTEAGTYYLGVHLYSNKYMGNCGFQKFEIARAAVTPAQVSDLAITAGAQGALTATLNWTAPTTTSEGGTLTDLVGVKVMRGTDQLADLPATAGQAMSYTDETITEAGFQTYSVVAYNNDGDAAGTATQVQSPWIGPDKPMYVTDLTATAQDEEVSLTWTAPTEGANGGYINPDAITYRITRASVVLEESWAGQLPYKTTVENLGKYTYTITPYYGTLQGATTSVTVTAGGAYGIPYSETFDSSSSLDYFTTFNNDGTRTWTYYSSKSLAQFWGGSTADAWLITPSIKMEAGKTYKMTFDTGLENANSSNYKNLYVTLGQGTTADAQSTQLYTEQIQSALMTSKEVYFSVPEGGKYNVGFRVYGQSSSYALFVDNILIEESTVVPAAVTGFTATAGDQGEYAVTLAWTNPAVDLAGAQLAAIDSVVVMNGDQVVYTLRETTPGADVQTVIPVYASGIHTYTALVYLAGAVSPEATATTGWVGHDTPSPVTDVTLVDNGGYPTLSFTAPTTGVNGGYIDTQSLTYRIVRNPGEIEVASAHTSTEFVDQTTLDLAQYTYTVYASALVGATRIESAGATSNSVAFGDALSLPYDADMTSADHMALWSFVDLNADGRCWSYKNNSITYDVMRNANDYAFTPPLRIEPGKCKLTYTVKGYNYRYSDAYEVVLTSTTDAAALTAATAQGAPMLREAGTVYTVLEAIDANALQSSIYATREVEFNITDAGTYYIGYHDVSTDSWAVTVGSTLVELTEPSTGVNDLAMTGACYYNRATQTLVMSADADVTVTAINGTVVATGHNVQSMSLSHLTAGIYVATVNNGGKRSVVKFVK